MLHQSLNRAWAVLLTLALCLISSASFGAEILNWSLDEGGGSIAADSSGQANTGTVSGNASWVPGRVGGALNFNGSNAALTRSNVQGMSLGNTPHTLTAWVKVNALPSNRAWIMLLGPEAAGSHHWLINRDAVTQLGVWNGAQVSPSLPVGVWIHVAITFDGSQIQGYIDGTLVGTQAANFNLTGTALTVAQSHVGEQYFNGEVDEVRVYNSALTAAEVAALAGATAPALAINTTTLPNGAVGNNYNQALSATGGTPPYAWSIIAGSLPAGLGLTGGTISGTPSTSGISNFTVRVTDTTDVTANQALSLTVASAPPATLGLVIATDNTDEVYLNGVLLGTASNWMQSSNYSAALQSGTNVLAVKGIDTGGPAGLIAELTLPSGKVVSNASWKVSTTAPEGWEAVGFNDSVWSAASQYGAYGSGPWYNNVSGFPSGSNANWIWTADNNNDDTAYFRYTFTVGSAPPPNVAPSISSVNATPQTLLDNATSQLQVSANDPDAGPAALSYTWSIVSGGGSLSSTTIANPVYTPANVGTSTPVTLNVVVSDGAASVNQNIVVTVNDAGAPIAISTNSLAAGTVGSAYNQTLTATGGIPPYTWSIVGGSLPAGLNLATNGALTGTPSAPGTSNFTVRVADANGGVANRPLTLTITKPVGGGAPLLNWSLNEGSGSVASDSSGGGNHGSVSGGATWVTGRVGGALSLDGGSGAVTLPTVQGLATGNGPHTIAAWVKVNALPSNRAWVLLLGAEGTGAHHWLLNNAGATQLGVWSGAQVAPVLPVGQWKHVAITFDGTTLTGYVDGVSIGSQAATFNLQGTSLTIAQAHVAENYFNGVVDDVRVYGRALSATEVATLAEVTANTPPTVSLDAPANGASYIAPATITLTANASDGDGSISQVEFYNGATLLTPDNTAPYTYTWLGVAAGSYALTAKAYDNSGAITTSNVVNVTVNPPSNVAPSISSVNATPQTLLDNATSQLQVTANDPDNGPGALSYTWSIVSGGGSLSSTTIANPVYTPANVGASTPVTINVVVSDGAASVSQNIVVTVNDAGTPIAISTTNLANGTVGSAYNQTLTATGGVPPYTWSITGGSLPAGITLNASGTISGTPTTAATASFTVRVQDSGGSSAIQPLSLVINAASGSSLYYLYADHLNTPRVITDTSNKVVWRWDSDPFGADAANEDPDGDSTKFRYNPRFPGQYFDKETGLHYNYFRDYEPTSGRYVQSDPIGLDGGINTYNYVGGNPVSRIDPLGLFFQFSNSQQSLTWVDPNTGGTSPSTTWPARSGPWGKGGLPQGWYDVTPEEKPVRSEKRSMQDTCGNDYKFRLHPQFETDRDGLLIHPDGGKPGTLGCIGAQGCTSTLRDFINSGIRGGGGLNLRVVP